VIDSLELKARRLNRKLSQREFAERLGITQEHYNRLENGKLPISRKLERRYEKLFGTRRLIEFRAERGVGCPFCGEIDLKQLSEPENRLNTIWHCRNCGRYFTTREAWHIED